MSLSETLRTNIIGRITGALFAVSAGVVVINEGTSYTAYRDGAGVWTICHGETLGVKAGDKATPAQCDAQLKRSLESHSKALDGLPDSTPDVAAIGALDLSYNVGVGAFSNSKIKRLMKQGDYKGAGKAVLEWKYIHRTSKTSPGRGWVKVEGNNRWRFDCSQYINGKPNTVCYGVWTRRQWQAAAIGLQYKTPEIALEALKQSKR